MKTNYFFISDLHLFHDNVIRFTNEDYKPWPEVNGLVSILDKTWSKPVIPENAEAWRELIRMNWNNKVRPNDVVYVVGDLVLGNRYNYDEFMEYLHSLNGEIRIIPGNHDGYLLNDFRRNKVPFVHEYHYDKKYGKVSVGPNYVETYIPVPNGGSAKYVILSHFPIFSYPGCSYKDTYHIYGHIHDQYSQITAYHKSLEESRVSDLKINAFNVGCMLPWMNFAPRSLEELIDAFK